MGLGTKTGARRSTDWRAARPKSGTVGGVYKLLRRDGKGENDLRDYNKRKRKEEQQQGWRQDDRYDNEGREQTPKYDCLKVPTLERQKAASHGLSRNDKTYIRCAGTNVKH